MKCASCPINEAKEVKKQGKPSPIYTGDFYQLYVHKDGSVTTSKQGHAHGGFIEPVEKLPSE